MATLDISAFFDKLYINNYKFELTENLVSSKDGAGQILVSSTGPMLFTGEVVCSAQSHKEARAMFALMQAIKNPDTTFNVYNPAYATPATYQTSHNLSGVKITTTTAGYTANLTGLPASYKLSAGDYFSVTISGVSRLFQLASDVTANASGVASTTLLNPLPAGIATNTAVVLVKPRVTARYVPNSMSMATVGLGSVEGFSFKWVQTFKA